MTRIYNLEYQQNVNLLRENLLHLKEKNQKILSQITTQIEILKHNHSRASTRAHLVDATLQPIRAPEFPKRYHPRHYCRYSLFHDYGAIGRRHTPPENCLHRKPLSHHSRRVNGHDSTYHAPSHQRKNSFTENIIDCMIPKFASKPLKLNNYGGIIVLDEHIEHVYTMLDYYKSKSVVKYKLFVLNLKGDSMKWYKTVKEGSINIWRKLCDELALWLTSCRPRPKTIQIVNGIYHQKKESLRD